MDDRIASTEVASLTVEELDAIRRARKIMEAVVAIPDQLWHDLDGQLIESFNIELTACGDLITVFKEKHGFLPPI